MKIFAQTNVQLLNQLRQLEYSESEITLAHQGYSLAMQIFAGQYRPSGKPFVCHLVGTASILADQKSPMDVVAAGLLHAAYTFGEFGSGYQSQSPAKRKQVRKFIGDGAEELVAEYAKFPWNRQAVLGLLNQDFNRFTNLRRQVLLLRLANELEEHLDLGALYCSDAEQRKAAVGSHLAKLVDVARTLQYDDLALMLREAFDECLCGPGGRLPTVGQPVSFFMAPLSHRPRLGARIKTFCEGPGRVLLRTGLGWTRGNAAERRIKEVIDRWIVR